MIPAQVLDDRARRRLILCRGLRSIGQGMLVVDFPLYLDALGWNGVQIGGLFTAIMLVQIVVTLFSGPLSDRHGRRGFLLAYDSVLVGAALLAFFTPAGWAVTLAALAGSFGRGMNGAAGAFSPVEQAWLARVTRPARRGGTFSLNTAVGSFGMAAGALIGALPSLSGHALPQAAAYRPMFLLVLVAAVATLGVILTLREPLHLPRPPQAPPRKEENSRILHIVLVTAINGAGIGLVTPLITYWFLVRFGKGPAEIAPVLAASAAAAGVMALFAGRLVRHGHLVKTVVIIRAVAVLLLLALPLAPTFLIAAFCYAARSALNRSTIGARQALNLSLVSDQRRGLAATLSSLGRQIPRSAGPIIAGTLFAARAFGVPFFAAAGLQGVYLFVYGRVFGSYEKRLPELADAGGTRRGPPS
ncbi:MAG TPA: MFS transporter [Nevskiaceae bacterium]